jgi:hypothetical protein
MNCASRLRMAEHYRHGKQAAPHTALRGPDQASDPTHLRHLSPICVICVSGNEHRACVYLTGILRNEPSLRPFKKRRTAKRTRAFILALESLPPVKEGRIPAPEPGREGAKFGIVAVSATLV